MTMLFRAEPAAADAMSKHGFETATFVGHSLGTVYLSWVARLRLSNGEERARTQLGAAAPALELLRGVHLQMCLGLPRLLQRPSLAPPPLQTPALLRRFLLTPLAPPQARIVTPEGFGAGVGGWGWG